jgi:cobalt-zinc-cadmium efflux system membrane fusion protein
LQGNVERIRTLVEKKIAARKEILQAETEYQTAMSELHADEERLRLRPLAIGFRGAHGEEESPLPVHSPSPGS